MEQVSQLIIELKKSLISFDNVLCEAQKYYRALIFELKEKDKSMYILEEGDYVNMIHKVYEDVHVIQMKITKRIGTSKKCLSLTQIKKRLGDIFDDSIIEIGNSCIKKYRYMIRRIKSIEQYFQSIVDEYQEFFNAVFTEEKKIYKDDGSNQKEHKHAVLISHHV